MKNMGNMAMPWYVGLLGLSQHGDHPMLDGYDGEGTQGPAIDIEFSMESTLQRGIFNFFRVFGFDDFGNIAIPYPMIDGKTKRGDRGPVTFYTRRRVPARERPAPGPPAPPAPAGRAFPGVALDYAMNYGHRIREGVRDYVRDIFPEARPAFAYA